MTYPHRDTLLSFLPYRSGERVAFSCMGSVSSITGEAEAGVALEALGTGTCQGHQEEAQSDQAGAFRIRGLLPGCAYRLRLKQGSDANHHIERAAPPEKLLQVRLLKTG